MFSDIIKINKKLLWDVSILLFLMLVFYFGIFFFVLNVDIVFCVIFDLEKLNVDEEYLWNCVIVEFLKL